MYLVSACLAGINCRYNGSNSSNQTVCKLVKEGKAIPICPEQIAGLPTPRACCEIIIDSDSNKKIVSSDGQDFTKYFVTGAQKALGLVKILNIKKAILQSRSPSCGYGCIYDGTFSGNLVNGNGFTAEILAQNGIEIYTEENIDSL